MKTTTSAFPNLSRLYPNHTIVSIKEAFKPGKRWINNENNDNVIAQVRSLRKRGYKSITFELKGNTINSEPFESSWGIHELAFYVPVTNKQYNSNSVRI